VRTEWRGDRDSLGHLEGHYKEGWRADLSDEKNTIIRGGGGQWAYAVIESIQGGSRTLRGDGYTRHDRLICPFPSCGSHFGQGGDIDVEEFLEFL